MATLTQAGVMISSHSTMLCNQSSPFAITLVVTPITGVTFQISQPDCGLPTGMPAVPLTGGDSVPTQYWCEE